MGHRLITCLQLARRCLGQFPLRLKDVVKGDDHDCDGLDIGYVWPGPLTRSCIIKCIRDYRQTRRQAYETCSLAPASSVVNLWD